MTDLSSIDALKSTLAKLADMKLPAEAQSAVQEAAGLSEKLAQELAALDQTAQDAQQARAKFVSVVTHELRLPLTSIKGYTDLLRQGIVGPVNDQQKNFLGVVRNNVDRMTALIADMADMAHLQSGKLKLTAKITTLSDIVEEALQPQRAKIEEKNQVLTVNLAENLPPLNQDHGRLVQILGYLLSNAQRYTPAGGKINLSASSEGEMLRLEITDTGIGVNEEDQKRLFTPFFRSEDEAVREHQGWGLALHVAKLLVELMGGQIGVQTSYRQGSSFWFTFPRSL